MKELINLDIPYENKLELINTIKLLLYKKDPHIFEEIAIDDESFFNPLLFAFFNQDVNNSLNVLLTRA